MLETVRAYASEQLDPAEQARLRTVHAAYFQTVATDAATGLESADEQRWAEQIDHALVNLRAAHRHLLAERDPGAAVIAVSLGWYWLNFGRFVEGRRWLEDDLATDLPEDLAVAARMWIARYDLDRGGFGQSEAAALGNVAVLEEVRASLDEHDDLRAWLRASDHFAHGLTLYEDTTRADEVAQASLDAWEPSLGAWWHSELLHRVAMAAQRRDDISGGLEAARAGLAISIEHGFTRGEMRCRQAIVNLEGGTSDPRDAIVDLRKVLVLSEQLGDARAETTTCTMLASYCLIGGDLPEAGVWFHRAMARGREVGYWHAQRFALMGLTSLAALRGDLVPAARWHGANRPHLDVIRRGMPPNQYGMYEWIVDDVRNKLGAERFEELAAAGTALDDAVVLDECLAWSAAPSTAVRRRRPDTAGARPHRRVGRSPDGAGDGCAAPHRRGAHQRQDRRRARHQSQDGDAPQRAHLPEAARAGPRRSGGPGPADGDPRRLSRARAEGGRSPDVPYPRPFVPSPQHEPGGTPT